MSKPALLIALILILTFFVSIQMVPSANASTISGISPAFADIYYVNVTGISKGQIVEYSFNSGDNLEFSIIGPAGLVHSFSNGYYATETYGFLANATGDYSFQWVNHNLVFYATVTYSINWTTPSLTLNSPAPGSVVHSLNPGLIGTCDPFANGVNLSVNNVSFTATQKEGSNWMGSIQLQSGSNSVFIAAYYECGSFIYRYVKQYVINTGFGLDFQPKLNITEPTTGTALHLLNSTIGGTCDDNASTISVSTDNITFTSAQKQGTSWTSSIQLASGQNIVYVKAGYVRGDFSYNYSRSFELTTGFGLDFAPSIALTSPQSGSSIIDLTPQLSGHCDENASWITYSLNNVTFYSTEKQVTNWISSTNSVLAPGSNTIYVKATYQRGDFWYNYTKAFSVNVDTTWVYQKNGNTNLGIGTIAGIIVLIALAGIGGFMLYRRRKKP